MRTLFSRSAISREKPWIRLLDKTLSLEVRYLLYKRLKKQLTFLSCSDNASTTSVLTSILRFKGSSMMSSRTHKTLLLST